MIFTKYSKLQYRLTSYDHDNLKLSCNIIKKILDPIYLAFESIVSLPTRKRIYCTLRSPHVNKDSREHFEIRIYTRMIEIFCFSKDGIYIIDQLNKSLPTGVYFSYKAYDFELDLDL